MIWHDILKNHPYDSIIFLIGNKSDLEKEKVVTIEDSKTFKNNYDDIKKFFEILALNGENIDKLFENIAIAIYEKDKNDENDLDNSMKDNRAIKLDKKNHKKKRKKKLIC